MKSLIDKFKKSLKGKILFLGIGNPLKSDDVAGLVLLEKIKQSSWAKELKAEFWNCSTSPENYLEKILKNNFDTIIIMDALHMNKEAGSIDLVDIDKITSFSVSTHSLSPEMFIDYLTDRSGSFPSCHPEERSDKGSYEILQSFGLQDEHSGENRKKNSPSAHLTDKKKLNIQFLGIQPKTVNLKENLSPEVWSSINKFVEDLSKDSKDSSSAFAGDHGFTCACLPDRQGGMRKIASADFTNRGKPKKYADEPAEAKGESALAKAGHTRYHGLAREVPLDKIIELPFNFKDEVLALGGQLKSAFCFAKDDRVFLSRTFGDLENLETLSVFEESIEDFKKRFKIKPKLIVSDLHPEYLSSKYAQNYILQSPNSKLIRVQHHHAHIASCMADNNMKNQRIIGVAFDGTGFGSDGNIWGGEFLVADYIDFKRTAHFSYIPLAGGAWAIKEPWRIAATYLYKTFKEDFFKTNIDFIKRLDKGKWLILKKMIDKGINSPLTSSIGRLFDAVSSLVGIKDKIEYEAEAAIELERAIRNSEGTEKYKYKINNDNGFFIIEPNTTIKEIVEDLREGFPVDKISLKFHNTVVEIIVDISKRIRKNTKISHVVLSGGVFQNKFIYKRAVDYLQSEDFKVFTHKRISTNDAGICLGQAAVARYRGVR